MILWILISLGHHEVPSSIEFSNYLSHNNTFLISWHTAFVRVTEVLSECELLTWMSIVMLRSQCFRPTGMSKPAPSDSEGWQSPLWSKNRCSEQLAFSWNQCMKKLPSTVSFSAAWNCSPSETEACRDSLSCHLLSHLVINNEGADTEQLVCLHQRIRPAQSQLFYKCVCLSFLPHHLPHVISLAK